MEGPTPPQIVWVMGRRDYPAFASCPAAQRSGVRVEPFVEEMGDLYAAADLVVSRAGATTLAELAAWGVPAVLVPYPFAAENDQAANAALLESRGAAVLVADRDLNPGSLTEAVRRLLASPEILAGMRRAIRSLGNPGAAEAVAGVVESLGRDRKGAGA
jgi:UDP-N-acetylglucosamine--N-acetylmuramyl-(pentapeptide) pyrophosphoryl-undecaprenol N-acetylglucosamine transferase